MDNEWKLSEESYLKIDRLSDKKKKQTRFLWRSLKNEQ